MKAITLDTFGGPEVLHVAEVPLPAPGPGQIRIQVRALAPNGIDAVLDAAGKGALPDSIELRGGIDRIIRSGRIASRPTCRFSAVDQPSDPAVASGVRGS